MPSPRVEAGRSAAARMAHAARFPRVPPDAPFSGVGGLVAGTYAAGRGDGFERVEHAGDGKRRSVAGGSELSSGSAMHDSNAASAKTQTGWRRFLTPEWRRRLAPWVALAFLALVVVLIADHVRGIPWHDVRAAVLAYPRTTLLLAAGL